MLFEQLIKTEEPAFEVYKLALETVFDKNDSTNEYLNRLTPEARLVYQVWNLDGEIHNGGFDQFFLNSISDHCEEILKYLEEINANNSIRLLKAAMSYFPNSYVPRDRQERLNLWLPVSDNEKSQDALEELDQEFYLYEDNLVGKLDEFVMSNRNAQVEA